VKPPGREWSDSIIVGIQKSDPYGISPEATAIGGGLFRLFGGKPPDVEHLDYPDVFRMEYEIERGGKGEGKGHFPYFERPAGI